MRERAEDAVLRLNVLVTTVVHPMKVRVTGKESIEFVMIESNVVLAKSRET